tara:strand:+ start:17832 stop:19949 length:2118 start_codon:yes stop_codon:yes gene_type:complete
MAINISNTTPTNTFEFWRLRTNDMANAFRLKVVSTSSNAAPGSAAITGTFSGLNLKANGTTQSTSKTTGALQTRGGLGVSKNAHIGGKLVVTGISNTANLNVAGTVSATLFSGDGSSLTSVDAETLDGKDSTDFVSNTFAIATFTTNNYAQSDTFKSDIGVVSNNYVEGRFTSNSFAKSIFTTNNYVEGRFTSNSFVKATFTSNNYVDNQLNTRIGIRATNTYVKSTFTSNNYVQNRFTSNNFAKATFTSNNYVDGRFTSNNYVDGRFTSNNFVKATFTSNNYVDNQLNSRIGIRATNTYVNSTFTSNNYVDGRFGSNNYLSTVVGIRATNTFVKSTFTSNNYVQGRFTSNNYIKDNFVSNNFVTDSFLRSDADDVVTGSISFNAVTDFTSTANLETGFVKLPNTANISIGNMGSNSNKFLRVNGDGTALVFSNSSIANTGDIGDIEINYAGISNADVLVWDENTSKFVNRPRSLIDVTSIDDIDDVNITQSRGDLLIRVVNTSNSSTFANTSNGFITGRLDSFSETELTGLTSNTISFTSTSNSLIQVFVNGVKLSNADFSVTNTSQIDVSSGVVSSDIVQIVEFDPHAFVVGDGTPSELNQLNYSDLRLKSNVEIYEASSSVFDINTYTYYWKDQFRFHDRQEVGFVAQDIEKYIPQVVSENSQGEKMVDYGKMTAVLLSTIKQLNERIEALESKAFCTCPEE